jgi:hypothetical protein
MHRDVAPEAAPPSEVTQGRKLVCVIGIDQYLTWRPLRNACSDARRIQAIFARLGFEEAVPPLLDRAASREALEDLVKDRLQTLDEADSLVLFFAGHGHARPHARGATGHLIPFDGELPGVKTSSWIDINAWLGDIARLPPRHVLVILDACYSGLAISEGMRGAPTLTEESFDPLRARRSRRVITSTMDDQRASDSGPLDGHSLFASGLIDALAASENGRIVTGTDLAQHVRRYVASHAGIKQTPDSDTFDDGRGDLIIAIPPMAADTVSPPPPSAASRRRSHRRLAFLATLPPLVALTAAAIMTRTPAPSAAPTPDAGTAPLALLAAEPMDAGVPPDAAPAAKPKTRRMAAPVPAPVTGRDDDVFAKVEAGDVAGMVALLLAGANVDAQGAFREKGTGATLRAPALGKAAYDCHRSMVEALIKYGASPRLGATVEGDKTWTAGTTPLMFAALRCKGRAGAAIVRALVGASAPIDQADDGGRTALHVVRDRLVAEALLAAQAPIEASAADGATPLIEAARSARKDVVKLLLEHGAKVGAKTAAGETGIWLASAAKLNHTTEAARVDVIVQLASAGANVDAAPAGTTSPLAQAIARDALDRAAILVRHGARLDPLIGAIGAATFQQETARKRALCAVLPATQHARVGC